MGQFTLLTWNIGLGLPSSRAPEWWDQEHNLNAILDEVERYRPDFICLQEMPVPEFADMILDKYQPAAPAESHSGYVTAFVRRAMIAGQEVLLDSQLNLPRGAGLLLQLGSTPLLVFSLHLPPHKNKASVRQRYLQDLVTQLPQGPLILAGDMNMREAETDVINDLDLTDVYTYLKPGKAHYATWDSTKNLFHTKSYPFRARFDRVFCRDLIPVDLRIVAQEPQTSEHHFLSDHYALLAKFEWD